MSEVAQEFEPKGSQTQVNLKKSESRREFLGKLTVLGLALFGLNRISAAIKELTETDKLRQAQVGKPEVTQEKVESIQSPPNIFEQVFPNLSPSEREEARNLVLEMQGVVTARAEYKDMVKITEEYEDYVRKVAAQINFPESLALGIILIENGGGVDKISEANARGVAQLMPATAKSYGLRVDDNWQQGGVDERGDPFKSLDVMGKFLSEHLEKFGGNIGLTVWSYHAGINIVWQAIKIYAAVTDGVILGDLASEKERVKKYNIHQVLSHPKVKVFTRTLDDESQFYPYKVVAAAYLFEIAGKL